MPLIDSVNQIKAKIIEILQNADIKNTRGISLKVVDTGLSSQIDKSLCPIVAVYKTEISGGYISIDQPFVEVPRTVTINLSVVDYAMTSVNEAESLTDDLINKIINAIYSNPTLDGLTQKIRIESIRFDEMRLEGVFYSIPNISLTVYLKEI